MSGSSSGGSSRTAATNISITRLELITAALLVALGIALWHIADGVSAYAFAGRAPEKEEFTSTEAVRTKESLLKTTQAEIEAVRAKLVEQRVAADTRRPELDPRLTSLERSIAAEERTLAGLRKRNPPLPDSVRSLESNLKTARAELDATRAKLVEQRVSINMPQQDWADRLDRLEMLLSSRNREFLETRRDSNRRFERAALGFTVMTRGGVLIAAALGTWILFWFFPAIGKSVGKRFGLDPEWKRVKTSAASILTIYYAFMAAGPAVAIGVAAVMVLWLLN